MKNTFIKLMEYYKNLMATIDLEEEISDMVEETGKAKQEEAPLLDM